MASISFVSDEEEENEVNTFDDGCTLSTICQMSSILPREVLLLEAARENKVPVLSVLVKHLKVSIDATDTMGRNALQWAAMRNSEESLELLLNDRVVAKEQVHKSLHHADKFGMTAMLWAAWCGHTKVMIRLIKEDNECASQVNKQGMNILHCAASNDQSHVVEFIGECLLGFRFSGKDQRGMTALHVSCLKGFSQSTRTLLRFSKECLDFTDEFGCTALHYACRQGGLESVRDLVKSEASLEIRDNLGQTPLHYAAAHDRHHVVRFLVKRLPPEGINRVTHKQQTSLMLAAGQGHVRVVKVLMECPQVDVNNRDEAGNTACHVVSRKIPGNDHVMELLLACGHCDVNVRNQNHETPLHVAVENSQRPVVVLLLRAGADIRARNKSSRTALDLAVRSDDVSIVDTLVEADRIKSEDEGHFQKVKFDSSTWRRNESNFREATQLDDDDEDEEVDGGNSSLAVPGASGSPGARGGRRRRRIEDIGIGIGDDSDDLFALDLLLSRDLERVAALETIREESESQFGNDDDDDKDDKEREKEEDGEPNDSTSVRLEEEREKEEEEEEEEEEARSTDQFVRRVFWRVAHGDMKHGDWKKLARHWRFEARHVDAIQRQFSASHRHRNHSYRLLMIWYRCFRELHPNDNPTRELYEAFVAIGNKKLATKIRKKMNNESSKSCTLS